MLTIEDMPGSPETKLLNTALVFEHAQAQFYEALMGHLTGALHRSARMADVGQIKVIAQVERDHRDLLLTILQTDGVAAPRFDFGMGGLTHEEAMNRALALERLTARAYLGILPLLPTARRATLLASLQGTESRHAATIGLLGNGLFKQANGIVPAAGGGGGYREAGISPREALAGLGGMVA